MSDAPASDRPVIDLVGGARPNFMKMASVWRALEEAGVLRSRVIHTGQHYDPLMSGVFFEQLGIPLPDVSLEVGSGTHGAQTARVLERYEAHLLESPPAAVVVFGDVNSTVACALAATKLDIPVVHVEAGLRSGDRTMPEEVNRVLTDAIADLLLVTEPSGLRHLEREGIDESKVALVGNVMIDTLLSFLPTASERARAASLGLEPGRYAFLTMHRPANVDDPEVLARIFDCIRDLASRLPVVFPVHPRTAERLGSLGRSFEREAAEVLVLPPQGYVDNLSLMAEAKLILTDSGGIQEEAAVLGVPCITLRESTERPVTLEVGASRLVGSDPARIHAAFDDVMNGRWGEFQRAALWDGRAGERAAAAIAELLGERNDACGNPTPAERGQLPSG